MHVTLILQTLLLSLTRCSQGTDADSLEPTLAKGTDHLDLRVSDAESEHDDLQAPENKTVTCKRENPDEELVYW